MRGRPLEHKVSDSYTRPADTTAYAAGDLVANSTTAGSVELLTFAFGNETWLRKVRLHKSDPDVTNAQFRLWLIDDSAVTFSNGDNGALAIGSSTLDIADVLATIDLTVAASLTGSGDVVQTTFDRGLYRLPATVYGFLEARAAYTPGSAEVLTVTLYGETY